MTSPLEKLLGERDWLLADGATGTNLFQAGLQSGDSPELWNEIFPDRVLNLYQNAVDSGSDVFLTNTFGCNAARLKLHDAEKKVFKLNKISAELGREIADRSSEAVIVAGSIGPTGEIFHPIGELRHEVAVEIFHEQAEGLKEGGVDVLWLETISGEDEFTAAAEAFNRASMPWCGTMSFDSAGRTMMGLTSRDMVSLVERLPYKPIAFGANCGVGASDLLRTVLGFSSTSTKLPIISKGNAGIPKFLHGEIHYDGTPELMAEYAILARNSGAKIIGGCCGTTPVHLKAMKLALEKHSVADKPTLLDIQEKIGDFSSISDGLDDTENSSRRKGRRKLRDQN